jgi:hypothetical protein
MLYTRGGIRCICNKPDVGSGVYVINQRWDQVSMCIPEVGSGAEEELTLPVDLRESLIEPEVVLLLGLGWGCYLLPHGKRQK